MLIPEIPDEHLERLHWYLGPGKGSEYAFRHLPSGILVGGTKPAEVKIHELEGHLLGELTAKLKAVGLITGTPTNEKGAHG